MEKTPINEIELNEVLARVGTAFHTKTFSEELKNDINSIARWSHFEQNETSPENQARITAMKNLILDYIKKNTKSVMKLRVLDKVEDCGDKTPWDSWFFAENKKSNQFLSKKSIYTDLDIIRKIQGYIGYRGVSEWTAGVGGSHFYIQHPKVGMCYFYFGVEFPDDIMAAWDTDIYFDFQEFFPYDYFNPTPHMCINNETEYNIAKIFFENSDEKNFLRRIIPELSEDVFMLERLTYERKLIINQEKRDAAFTAKYLSRK